VLAQKNRDQKFSTTIELCLTLWYFSILRCHSVCSEFLANISMKRKKFKLSRSDIQWEKYNYVTVWNSSWTNIQNRLFFPSGFFHVAQIEFTTDLQHLRAFSDVPSVTCFHFAYLLYLSYSSCLNGCKSKIGKNDISSVMDGHSILITYPGALIRQLSASL
jgi:hypothetical protein